MQICKKLLFLTIVSLLYANDIADTNNTVPLTQDWIHPSKELCQKYGGKMLRDSCSNLSPKNATKLCKSLDAEMPMMNDYINLAEHCGISPYYEIHNHEFKYYQSIIRNRNKGNFAYQQCIHKLGFKEYNSDYLGYASTEVKGNFPFNVESAIGQVSSYSWGDFVVCVKGKNEK